MDGFEKKKLGLGIYLIVLAVVLAYLIISFWPGNAGGEGKWENAVILGKECKMNSEVRLFFLVLLIGAFGSFVHAATSFVTYVGNKSLAPSWMWWYVLRPFIGMGIAAIFYLVLRGGLVLLSAPLDLKTLNPYGIGAFAALSGMFSKQAADKLSDIFDNLFRTQKGKGDEERANKLDEMRPVKDLMLGINKISYHKMGDKEEPKDVTIEKLYGYLTKEGVTRIPILDHKGAIKFIVHQSMLYKFISEKSMKAGATAPTITALTLQDLLEFSNMRDLVEKSLAFVSEKATLGEAKATMEKTKNCQDVFVTENGRADEPIIGWLPNTELSKHAKA
jgi:hypothetical protein